MGSAVHVETMEMQRSRLVAQVIVSIDDDPITNVNLDCRDWPLAIDANDWALESIVRISSDPANIKIKLSGSCRSEMGKGEKQCCLN